MGHRPTRVGFESERRADPPLAEIADERVVIALGGVGEAVEKTMRAFEHSARASETMLCHQGGAHSRLRRPTCMHALGLAALGKLFDDAGCRAAGAAGR